MFNNAQDEWKKWSLEETKAWMNEWMNETSNMTQYKKELWD